MINNKTASFAQLATAGIRPFAYSVAVAKLGAHVDARPIVLLIGYIPLFSMLDAFVQSASRWLHLRRKRVRALASGGAAVGIVSLGCYGAAALIGASATESGWYLWCIIIAYVSNSLALLWERRLASVRGAFQGAVLEGVGALLCLAAIGGGVTGIWLYVIQITLFPLSRLLVIIWSGRYAEHEVVASAADCLGSARSFIGYSVGQQGIAALAASLPTIGAQLTDSYARLPNALIIFKFMNTAAAMASLTVNILGPRIFYGTLGASWDCFEWKLSEHLRSLFAVAVVSAGLGGLYVASGLKTEGGEAVAVGLVVPALAVTNLLSSLCLSRGLPRLTFLCQAVVCCSAVAVCCWLFVSAGVTVAFWSLAVIAFIAVNRIVVPAYRSVLESQIMVKGQRAEAR